MKVYACTGCLYLWHKCLCMFCFSSQIDQEARNQDPNLDCHPNQNFNSEDEENEFWEKPCAFTPESRLEAHHNLEEKRRAKERVRYIDCLGEGIRARKWWWGGGKNMDGGRKNINIHQEKAELEHLWPLVLVNFSTIFERQLECTYSNDMKSGCLLMETLVQTKVTKKKLDPCTQTVLVYIEVDKKTCLKKRTFRYQLTSYIRTYTRCPLYYEHLYTYIFMQLAN